MENHSFQKQNQYNKFLPYFEELEKQADEEFDEILQNLKELKKPVLDVPKLIQWTHVLENYIAKHGFRFTKKDHVWLVTYFYDLLCGVKNVDKGSFYKISKMTHTLLAKEYLLTGSDLQLDWKPLAQLIEYYWYGHFQSRNLDIILVIKVGRSRKSKVDFCRLDLKSVFADRPKTTFSDFFSLFSRENRSTIFRQIIKYCGKMQNNQLL